MPLALSAINLEVNERECIMLNGLSGSGKSTLCLAAADFLKAFPAAVSSGKIIRHRTEQEGGTGIAMVMQNFYSQITYLRPTVFEEIAFPCENLGLPRDEIIERTDDAIARIRIGHLAGRNPLDLSGGEKQKVVLATAIAMSPDLLILDEPLSQLDPESTSHLGEILSGLKRSMSLIIAENDPYLTLKVADRVVVLSDGKILADGKLENILGPDVECEIDLPAWTRCIMELQNGDRTRDHAGTAIRYELNYKRAIETMRKI